MISVAKSLGIIRNKTYLLTEYKLAISSKKAKHSKRDSESDFLLSFPSYKYTKLFFHQIKRHNHCFLTKWSQALIIL